MPFGLFFPYTIFPYTRIPQELPASFIFSALLSLILIYLSSFVAHPIGIAYGERVKMPPIEAHPKKEQSFRPNGCTGNPAQTEWRNLSACSREIVGYCD